MSTTRSTQPVLDKLWILGLVVGLPVLGMLLRGVDANWDMRNYHLYNPHAWLTGRMAIDITAAQLQSWHNPLLDLPFYLLITSNLGARWAGLWLLLPAMASVYFLLRLQRVLGLSPPSRTSQAVLAVLALSGAAHYSTLATSINDGFVGAGLLGSLWLILGDERGLGGKQRWLLAGLLAGAITGLKLSASFYCIALALTALAAGDIREKAWRLGSLAVGGATGFALTYAWWGWTLFKTFGNPFFPYYNHIFQSPAAQLESFADARFRPQTLADALLSPVQLLLPNAKFSELPLSDPRLLLGMLSLAGLYFVYQSRVTASAATRARINMLLVFFLSAFALWVAQYGIYRYAIVLELLGCLALVLLVQCLPKWQNGALLLAALLVSADTRRPDWGHTPSTVAKAGIKPASVPPDSLVVISSGEPLAFVALGLPREVPLVAVFNNMMRPQLCTGLNMKARAAVSRHQGPVWLLRGPEGESEPEQALLTEHYGLAAAGECIVFESAIGNAHLCPQRRLAIAAPGPDCPAQP